MITQWLKASLVHLKSECVTHQFATQGLARTAIFEYIEVWYNRQRLHFTGGYLSPLN